jgi:hypothetical protein
MQVGSFKACSGPFVLVFCQAHDTHLTIACSGKASVMCQPAFQSRRSNRASGSQNYMGWSAWAWMCNKIWDDNYMPASLSKYDMPCGNNV